VAPKLAIFSLEFIYPLKLLKSGILWASARKELFALICVFGIAKFFFAKKWYEASFFL